MANPHARDKCAGAMQQCAACRGWKEKAAIRGMPRKKMAAISGESGRWRP
jgi:hypothetical protein